VYGYTKPEALYSGDLVNASTGESTSGTTDSAKQTMTEKNISHSAVAPDLDNFIACIKGLKILKPNWLISSICVGRGVKVKHDVWNSYFPKVPCEKQTSQIRQFSYIDDEKKITRRLIAVEIQINNKFIY